MIGDRKVPLSRDCGVFPLLARMSSEYLQSCYFARRACTRGAIRFRAKILLATQPSRCVHLEGSHPVWRGDHVLGSRRDPWTERRGGPCVISGEARCQPYLSRSRILQTELFRVML